MATVQQGGKGSTSGGPNETGSDKDKTKGQRPTTPFAVEQARRVLQDAQDRLKAAKQGSADFKAAKKAVDEAEQQLKKLTTGSKAAQSTARENYMREYFDNLGGDWVQSLYQDFPQLRDLLEKAIRKGWADSPQGQQNFLDEFFETDFYKQPNRGIDWFSTFQLEFGDARNQKIFADRKRAQYDAIRVAADKYGIKLSDAQVDQLAKRSLYSGWTATDIDSEIANRYRKATDNYKDPEFRAGEGVAANEVKVRDLAKAMGVKLSDQNVRRLAARLSETRQNFSDRDLQELLLRTATERDFGDLSELFGFVGEEGAFKSLRSAVSAALDSGGNVLRRFMSNARVKQLLSEWRDPGGRTMAALWQEKLDDARLRVVAEARALGLSLDEATIGRLSAEYQYENWATNPMGLKKALAALVEDPDLGDDIDLGDDTGGDGDDTGGDGDDTGGDTDPPGPRNPGDPVWSGGSQAELERQLRSWARNYGVDLGDEWYKSWVNKIILTPDQGFSDTDAKNEIIKLSRQIYPVFSQEINDGSTVRDAAAGYISRLANLLELDSGAVELSDPLLQRALTGRGEDGKPSVPNLYDFAAMVRQDDRWQATDNAFNSYAAISNDILKKMGFVG